MEIKFTHDTEGSIYDLLKRWGDFITLSKEELALRERDNDDALYSMELKHLIPRLRQRFFP